MSGINDYDIPFKDLCKILETVGFQKRIKGDHHIFYKDGIEEIINIQPAHSKAKAYQVTKANPKRADFFNALENMPFDKALKKYVHKSVFRQSKAYLKRILRKLLS